FFQIGDPPVHIRSITFDQWKEKNGFRECAAPGVCSSTDVTDDVRALYFNAADLGIARAMHAKTSVVFGEKRTAYYVCNYGRPGVDTPQSALDQAKRDEFPEPGFINIPNQHAAACVAFDFSQFSPFTKFYVFKLGLGDFFNLAASADLDGRKG